jgi:cardiolipin synthase A/B
MLHDQLAWGFFVIDLALRLFFCLRVIQRRLPVGVAWAWLSIILFLPIGGTLLYLYLGEYRLGRRRLARLDSAALTIRGLVRTLAAKNSDDSVLKGSARSFARAVRGFFEAPLLDGNDLELLNDASEAFPRMIEDIDRSKVRCDMEFFIWSDGGRADEFAEALIRAAERGIACRILVDQVGSRAFLRGKIAKKLRASGVKIQAAMPVSFMRSLFARPDLRIHRKILIIDGAIAYTGSLNIADPLLFKLSVGVGEWVDAFCRIRGPAVQALGFVFLNDWCVETQTDLLVLEKEISFSDIAEKRGAKIQCLPSGPALKNSAIEEVLTMAIYSARHRLVLTTPYFVPSDPLLYALIAAARRGVKVTLIVPAKVDSRITQYASHAFYRELVEVGVQVALFNGGMLHTKSVVIDGIFSIFGSLNLDPRSLRINFEITLAIYDESFAEDLNALQMKYFKKSTLLEKSALESQRWPARLREDFARLASPLL